MPIFHGDRWLHLLVFIWERTTKNLQLLQTRVTHTLSCVWLWCTSTFLAEKMKGHQAAESSTQDQLLWAAPTPRSLCCPSSFPGCWSLWGSPLWLGPKSQQAIKVVLCFTHTAKPGLSLNVSLVTQGKARRGIHWSAAIYTSDWMTWVGRCSIRRISGKLQESYGHTLINNFKKLPHVMNTDFNLRKRMYQ